MRSFNSGKIKEKMTAFMGRFRAFSKENGSGMSGFGPDMEDDFKSFYVTCKPYTLTSVERLYALYQAVKYGLGLRISGDFVECGVWKGGSAMMAALTLMRYGGTDKKIFLYDTFEGMSRPSARDKQASTGFPAFDTWEGKHRCFASLENARGNILSTGYPPQNIVFIKGKVEDTIPKTLPERISLLRLDTDWYDSTYHELVHLFPRLSDNGVVILDDYGHWTGAREAADKYFAQHKITILLNRIDYTGRLGIKTKRSVTANGDN